MANPLERPSDGEPTEEHATSRKAANGKHQRTDAPVSPGTPPSRTATLSVAEKRELLQERHPKAQAERLGEFLRRWEVFTGRYRGVDIILSREGDTYVVSVPLNRDWDELQTIDFYTQMRAALAAEVFDGAPVEVHLIDTFYRTQGELGVKRVIR